MEDRFLIEERLGLESRLKSGANWFFVIAALSVINSLILLMGGKWNFIVGLGITQVISAIGNQLGPIWKTVAFILSLIAAGFFAFFGAFARKGHKWAFIAGMILYAFDGLLFVLVQDWLGIGFHLFALYCIYKGLQALNGLGRLEAEKSAAPPPAP
jgi:hypothetical protein